MKVLITGASGQLSRAFIKRFEQDKIAYLAPPEAELDITKCEVVDAAVAAYQPDVIINGAAYNNVDGAENTPEIAFTVNRDAVAILAAAARKQGAKLVHFGTDFVFDGKTETPYRETDTPLPLSVYGQSKLEGENAALAEHDANLVFRVSWVFGDGQQNFFSKLREWTRGKSAIRVVWDQVSVPTYTEDIVTVTLKALEAGLSGRWHLTNSGYASRCETARIFLRELGSDCTVVPVGSDAFPAPAQRPFFSVMSNQKLCERLDIEIPQWENAVARFANRLNNAAPEPRL